MSTILSTTTTDALEDSQDPQVQFLDKEYEKLKANAIALKT